MRHRWALAAMMAMGLMATGSTTAAAADAAGCKDPAWAPQRLPGFAIDSCETKNWTGYQIDLPGGQKTIYGQRDAVTYALTDTSSNGPTAAAARTFYLQQAQKTGAKLASDPSDGWKVVFTDKSAKGEFWYLYEHGNGNETSTGSYTLTTIHVVPLLQQVQAQAMKAAPDPTSKQCGNPPWLVKQFTHYKIDSCDGRSHDQVQVDLPGGAKTLEGARTATYYAVDDGKNAETDDSVQKNYIAALKAIGATLVSDPSDESKAVFTQKTPLGEFWYIYAGGSGNSDSRSTYSLTTVQVAALDQQVQTQPMKSPLDTLAKCSDPPWVVKQFPQYKVSDCDNRIWDVVSVDLASGSKTVEGKRTEVTYALSDENKNETAVTIQKNYVQAFKAMGATTLSDLSQANRVVATQKNAAGEFWFIYSHGSGNDESTTSYSLTTVQIAPFPQVVQAQLMKSGLTPQSKPCRNPDWLVKQFGYFAIEECSYRDFDSVTLDLPAGKKVVAGRVLTTDFRLTDPNQTPTQFYAYRNYVSALQAIGAKLVSDPKNAGRAVLTQKTAQGEFWYIYSQSSGNDESTNSYELVTIQVGGPPPKACTLEVYGVNFDFDKSTLRPDSEPVLEQLLAMFKADPKYAAEIGGHTDNIGTASYNMALSGTRAEAVKAWLVAHGIPATRIATHGYGDTKPLVPNTTDANRAKNRRVELKRTNCK